MVCINQVYTPYTETDGKYSADDIISISKHLKGVVKTAIKYETTGDTIKKLNLNNK